MFVGNEKYRDLEFYLEDVRRDLTVQDRASKEIFEWVEAKMCWTDCLARELTCRGDAFDYCRQLRLDAVKQNDGMATANQTCVKSLMLFAVHFESALPRQKYYSNVANRQFHSAEDIEEGAKRHTRTILKDAVGGDISEDFQIMLDRGCKLLVFVIRPREHRWKLNPMECDTFVT
jgi:hypothetical protein